jgi:flagellar assembly factor FliW
MESVTQTVETMSVNLPRFGEFAYAQTDVFEFPWGLPGFPEHHRWLFLTLDSQPSFVWLQSLDDLGVALPAANPWMIFDEYDPKIPAHAFTSLEIQGAADFTFLCVMVVTAEARDMTMNLASPIVVNLRTRKARQVTIEDGGYSLRAPIPRKSDTADAVVAAKAS